MKPAQSKLWYLSKIQLFAAMSPADMAQMEKITRMESTPKFQPIYLPGDPATSVYLLKKGRVRITGLSPEGKQMIHAILEPGNLFGEISLVEEGGEYDSMAEAIEDTLLCIIHKQDFEAFLEMHPQLNLKVTKLIGLRLRQVTSRVQDLVFKTPVQRIETMLSQLAEEHGRPVAEGKLIDLPLTQQDLGDLTNLSRASVSGIIKDMERSGRLLVQRRRMILPHPTAIGQPH